MQTIWHTVHSWSKSESVEHIRSNCQLKIDIYMKEGYLSICKDIQHLKVQIIDPCRQLGNVCLNKCDLYLAHTTT